MLRRVGRLLASTASPLTPSAEYARRVESGLLRHDAGQAAALQVLDRVHAALDGSSPAPPPAARESRGLFASLFGASAAAEAHASTRGVYLCDGGGLGAIFKELAV